MHGEVVIRLGFFFGILLVMALWELAFPKRSLTVSKTGRWVNNLGIIVIDNVMIRLLTPAAALGMAVAAQRNGWGLLNQFQVPAVPAIIIGVLFLDMVIYLQHLMFHSVPLLWRLHMMHHADLDIDLTTGLRFHPIEILISMGIKVAAVSVIGPPIVAVLAFEVILNGTAMFNHGNVHMPRALDRVLRLLVVTPDMHRVHHSVTIRETNSNFGFNFPWWDRIFGTYRAQPVAGHQDMTIGLAQFRNPKKLTLLHLLVLPFTGYPGSYAINKSGMEPIKRAKKGQKDSPQSNAPSRGK
jgi:sterol desaturase/sphingolipid hydroxylase (fatty acid hydroxylase superfamily)